MTRDTAWQIVTEFVKDEGLRHHVLAVEAAMRFYAGKLSADPDAWAVVGLLHDFDWEIHPTLDKHPRDGAAILRQRGLDDDSIRAILSHNTAASGIERQRPIDFALLACDEITGLVIATALVRPSKNIADVEVKSLKKKWKEKSFAAGVDRAQVEAATADFSRACFAGSLDLWQHAANVLAAMQAIAANLALAGEGAPSGTAPKP